MSFQLIDQESQINVIFHVQIHIYVRLGPLCQDCIVGISRLAPESISILFEQFMHNRRILKIFRLFTGASKRNTGIHIFS